MTITLCKASLNAQNPADMLLQRGVAPEETGLGLKGAGEGWGEGLCYASACAEVDPTGMRV